MKLRHLHKAINRKHYYKHFPKYLSRIMCSHSPGSVTYTCGKVSITRPDHLLDGTLFDDGFYMVSAEDLVRL